MAGNVDVSKLIFRRVNTRRIDSLTRCFFIRLYGVHNKNGTFDNIILYIIHIDTKISHSKTTPVFSHPPRLIYMETLKIHRKRCKLY